MRRLTSLVSFLKRWAFWIAIGLALLLSAGFVELSQELFDQEPAPYPFHGMDSAVLHWMLSIRRPWLNGVTVDLTALGSPLVVALFTCALGTVQIIKSDRRAAVALALVSFVSLGLTSGLKALLERPRPQVIPRLLEVSSLSYPSGHSLASAAVYLTAAFTVSRHFPRWGQRVGAVGLTGVVVVFIGMSRVYLGVHYPSDVVAGILVGTACALVAGALLHRVDLALASPSTAQRP